MKKEVLVSEDYEDPKDRQIDRNRGFYIDVIRNSEESYASWLIFFFLIS